MNLGIVTPFFTPVVGGEATAPYTLARGLKARGHSVTIFTTNYGRRESKFEDEGGLTIVESRCVANFSGLLYTPEMRGKLKETARTIDIFDFNSFRTYQNVIAMGFAREHRMPYVLRAHGSLQRLGKSVPKLFFDRLYGYSVIRNASKLIALTPIEAEQYTALGVPQDKIAVVPNGIDLTEYSHLPPRGTFRRKIGLDENNMMVLYLGRIHRSKRIDVLVRSFQLVTQRMKNARLVIAGYDDGYLQYLRFLTQSLGLNDYVIFTGPLNESDKQAALSDAGVFVTPSFYGFPMTFLEACAVGTPIIATNLGDVLSWIDGVCGYVTSPDPAELAHAICRVLLDGDVRAKFSENCKSIVQLKFSAAGIAKILESTYEGLVGHTSPRQGGN
ncbi:MAG: glycosyltransferase family 4 protein [Nitrososphaerales archaeon]